MRISVGATLCCLFSAGLAVADQPVQERFRHEAHLVRFLPGEATWMLRPGPAAPAARNPAGALPRLSVRRAGPAASAGFGSGNVESSVSVPPEPHGTALPKDKSTLGGVTP